MLSVSNNGSPSLEPLKNAARSQAPARTRSSVRRQRKGKRALKGSNGWGCLRFRNSDLKENLSGRSLEWANHRRGRGCNLELQSFTGSCTSIERDVQRLAQPRHALLQDRQTWLIHSSDGITGNTTSSCMWYENMCARTSGGRRRSGER